MKVLLTGTNGFIGKNLLSKLIHDFPDYAFNILVRKDVELSDNPKIKYFKVNYLDVETIINSGALENVELIFHVAGVTKSHTWEGFVKGNIRPVENLLLAVKKMHLKLKRFVLISSQSAGGPAEFEEHLKSETERANPFDQYGKSKLAAERIVESYGSVIPYTIIRPAGVFGPGDVDFLKIFQMTKTGISVYAGVKNKWVSLIYVEDLIEGIIKAAFSENTIGKVYNICEDRPRTWKEIHNKIFEVAGKKKINISIPYYPILWASYLGDLFSHLTGKTGIFNSNKILLSKPKYWIASNERAKKDFGFETKYKFGEAIKKTYEWYLKNQWL